MLHLRAFLSCLHFNDKKDDDHHHPDLIETAGLRPSRVISPLYVLTSGVIDGCY
jgi:hypothetical protein